jgi:ABC-type amino acid transport substrate-binding protein
MRATPVTRIGSIDDAIAQNKRICVWGAAADWELVSQQYPKANLRKSADHQGAILDMAAGLCDAAVVSNNEWSVLQSQAKFNGNCTLQYVGRPLFVISAGFAVAQDSTDKCSSLLRDVLDIHFKNMKREGFIDAAWAKHLKRAQEAPGVGGSVSCPSLRRSAGVRCRSRRRP